MSPQRIQRKRTKGWRMPEGAVYVGRPSRWGNPFAVFGGTSAGPPWHEAKAAVLDAAVRVPSTVHLYTSCSDHRVAVADAVDTFRTLVQVRQRDLPRQEMDAWLYPLRGRDLACWCPLDQPCHADVLLEVANR